MTVSPTFLTPKRVCERTTLSRASLDRLVAAGEFPKPVKITDRRLAFQESEVLAWMQSKLEAIA